MFTKEQMPHEHHDEGVDKGNGKRVGKRQIAQRRVHGGDAGDMHNAARQQNTEDVPAHADLAAGSKNDRDRQNGLGCITCQ